MGRYLFVGVIGLLSLILAFTSLSIWGLSTVVDSHQEEIMVANIQSDISFLLRNQPTQKQLLENIELKDSISVGELKKLQNIVGKIAQAAAKNNLKDINYYLNRRKTTATHKAINLFLQNFKIASRLTTSQLTYREKQFLKQLKEVKKSNLTRRVIAKKLQEILPQLDDMVDIIPQSLAIAKTY